MAQRASPPWQTAACIDRLTQTCEVTLKWRKPDGRDGFSMFCHNGMTEYTGPAAGRKQITLHNGAINLF